MQNKNLTQIARKLRKQMTPEEHILWYNLRSGRFSGYKFRRQFPIDKYVVDFICLAKRLIVEADGGQHNQSTDDVNRDKYLRGQNFTILRFWNNDINQNLELVLQKIFNELQNPHPNCEVLRPLP